MQDNAWHRGKTMMDPIQEEQREQQMHCWTEVGQGGNRAQELGGSSLCIKRDNTLPCRATDVAGEKNGQALRENGDGQDSLLPSFMPLEQLQSSKRLRCFFYFFFLFDLSYSMRSNEGGIETLLSLVHVFTDDRAV